MDKKVYCVVCLQPIECEMPKSVERALLRLGVQISHPNCHSVVAGSQGTTVIPHGIEDNITLFKYLTD